MPSFPVIRGGYKTTAPAGFTLKYRVYVSFLYFWLLLSMGNTLCVFVGIRPSHIGHALPHRLMAY